jgi:DNA-binding NarL/FixJ family response regulator
MPNMNGPQFLAKLRETHPNLPVVIVTGYPDSDLMKQAMQYAPLMLLAKPAETDQLERTIRLVLCEKTAARRT